jgi:hypothetical protein
MHHLPRKLHRIRIAQHVPLPHNATHPRELHTHRLKAAASALLEALLPRGDLHPQLLRRLFRETRIFPMSVREHHARHPALHVLRAVQISRHKEAGRALEIHLLHGVFGSLDAAVDHRVQRRLRGYRPQPLRDENLPAYEVRALSPGGLRRRRGKGEVAVEILGRREADVVGQSAGGKHPRGLGEGGRNGGSQCDRDEDGDRFHGDGEQRGVADVRVTLQSLPSPQP